MGRGGVSSRDFCTQKDPAVFLFSLITSWSWEEQMQDKKGDKILDSVVIQSLSRVQLFVTPWTAAQQGSLSITNSWSLLKLMSIELVMPSNHLIRCHPLLLLPSIFPSIRVFSSESDLHIRWPKCWNFIFIISPSNDYSELISFKIDCFDLLAVQGTLKSLLQHHSLKTSILWHSAFFMVHLSHPWASLVAQLAKHPPAMQETWVQPLGWEDPLERKKATHSSILA